MVDSAAVGRGRARLVASTLVGVVSLVAIAAVGAVLFGPIIRAASERVVAVIGLPGVGLGTMITDSSPLPLPHEPLLFVAVSGGLAPASIILFGTVGSIAAAFVGYGGGTLLEQAGLTDRLLGRRAPAVRQLIARHGFWGIAAAAVTPLPYSMCNWMAGAFAMPLHLFAVAVLLRSIKVTVTVWLLAIGWSALG